jgi:hypothetical protein
MVKPWRILKNNAICNPTEKAMGSLQSVWQKMLSR